MESAAIIKAITGVTKRWAKQRKAEERRASRESRRWEMLTRSRDRYTLKDAAADEIPEAYAKASSDGTLPATARQIMYAARGPIQDATGLALDDTYFTQTLLPAYLRDNPVETADWDVVFDARGHFHEPHTQVIVPLGTLDVRAYLSEGDSDHEESKLVRTVPLFATHGPRNRFNAVLFIEKEGFLPLFENVQLAERYDLAIMSTKGMSVTASRLLVDRMCGEHRIPLLVLHDFDKSGFSILGSLCRSNDRYRFSNKIKVIDLGLKLDDVQQNELESESVTVNGNRKFRENLARNGATQEEVAFLAGGQRVELNAMTAAQLVAWIEAKLAERGIKKVIPGSKVLAQAYRSAIKAEFVRTHSVELQREAERFAAAAKVPKNLEAAIRSAFKTSPAHSWDRVVAAIAGRKSETK